MSEQEKTLQIIEGIYDIQPLVEPALSLLEKSLLSIFFFSVTSFVFYIIWKNIFSKKAAAKREIKKLHHIYIKNKINNHDVVYQLCILTKYGLKLKNLNNEVILPTKLTSMRKQWEIYIEDISAMRYQDIEKQSVKLDKLFADSLFWLKVWP